MFNNFLALIWGVLPFLKELILGNQSARDVILKNKLFVFLLLLFLFMVGSNLYMDDTVKYLRGKETTYQHQISVLQNKNSIPPKLNTVSCPGIAAPAATPRMTIAPDETPQEKSKDIEIANLHQRLNRRARKKSKGDPLDKLYRTH